MGNIPISLESKLLGWMGAKVVACKCCKGGFFFFFFFSYLCYCNPHFDDMHFVTLKVVAKWNNPFGTCGLYGLK
jgi:hypothetical protein